MVVAKQSSESFAELDWCVAGVFAYDDNQNRTDDGKQNGADNRVKEEILGAGNAYRWLMTDQLGSVRRVLADNGTVIGKLDYDTFGVASVTMNSGKPAPRHQYTGQQADVETGLGYFDARYYQADVGRFINQDPIRDGVNWYAYVGNDPVNFSDPTGLKASFGLAGSSSKSISRSGASLDDRLNQLVANYFGDIGPFDSGPRLSIDPRVSSWSFSSTRGSDVPLDGGRLRGMINGALGIRSAEEFSIGTSSTLDGYLYPGGLGYTGMNTSQYIPPSPNPSRGGDVIRGMTADEARRSDFIRSLKTEEQRQEFYAREHKKVYLRSTYNLSTATGWAGATLDSMFNPAFGVSFNQFAGGYLAVRNSTAPSTRSLARVAAQNRFVSGVSAQVVRGQALTAEVTANVSGVRGLTTPQLVIPGVRPANPIEVTAETIRAAMKDAPLQTQQGSVSLPAVQRYVRMLENGETPPAIKVDGNIIVEGNHRYVAGRVFGQEPPTTPWPGGNPARVTPWNSLKIDPTDWGNR